MNPNDLWRELDDDPMGFEDAVDIQEFIDNEDYAGLLLFQRRRLAKRPADCYAQASVGKALNQNGRYSEAIEFLTPYYRDFPENGDFERYLLDALFGLGLTERDFDWVVEPVVWRISEEMLSCCYDYLRPKRKPRTILDLHTHFDLNGYAAFSPEELHLALDADSRFLVSGVGFFAEVGTVPRGRRK